MTPTTQDLVEKLQAALDERPTPGEWKAMQSEVWVGNRRICPRVCAGETLGLQAAMDREYVNAAFIAAANPTAIRALLDAIREQEEALRKIADLDTNPMCASEVIELARTAPLYPEGLTP